MSHIHIDVNNLSFEYEPGIPVLKNVSFHISENESVGIVGANGAGKSTLLRILLGLEMEFEGNVRIMDIPMQKSTLGRIRERIGYVFQDSDSQLFMSTVGEDVAFGPGNYGLSEAEVEKRVRDALDAVGILHLKDRPVYKLSGGEKKLASIATILSMTPDIICMDEPSIALDPKNRERLIEVINSFSHLKIISSHDIDMIKRTCRRVIILKEGEVLGDGPVKEVLDKWKADAWGSVYEGV